MTDIIFHIGFPKCASSTLQKKVFQTDPGYLGSKKRINNVDYAGWFQKFSPIGVRLYGSFKEAEKWKSEVLEYQKIHQLNLDRLIISSENFTQKNKLTYRPMIKFLKRFNENIWDAGSVKIVLIIRNQAETIASLYAQVSNKNPNASQTDFLHHVTRYLRRSGRQKDYSLWVNELQNVFGRENVKILLMEDIGKIDFWLELKSFCDLSEFEPESMLKVRGENVRRKGGDIWSIRAFDSDLKADVWADNIFRLAWPYRFKKDLRESSRQSFEKMFKNYFESSLYNTNSETREDQIQLTDDVQKKIKEYYRESNMRLSELLSRDLIKLGY